MSDADPRQLLQQLPAELEKLLLDSRAIATNALTGLHRSPYRGSSIEFREHREYQHGDDLRRLDWRVMPNLTASTSNNSKMRQPDCRNRRRYIFFDELSFVLDQSQ